MSREKSSHNFYYVIFFARLIIIICVGKTVLEIILHGFTRTSKVKPDKNSKDFVIRIIGMVQDINTKETTER